MLSLFGGALTITLFLVGPIHALSTQNMMLLRDAKSQRVSSFDRTGGNKDWTVFEPGSTHTLAEFEGSGCVNHFYCTYIIPDATNRRALFRDLILRMYWDGEELPSVECPFGDFFGISNCTPRPLRSLLLVVNPGAGGGDASWGLNSYFPMPFSEGGRIELTNESDVQLGVWFHIDYESYPSPPGWMEDAGRFHAQFRRTCPTEIADLKGINLDGSENYLILDATGEGNLDGYMLSVDNITGGWWGEGDDMIFIDGEIWPPSFHGTGSEEIFGGGACPDVEYSGPYTGFHLVENREGESWYGKNGMYRFFVNDPVRFKKSVSLSIEHGHANDLANDYSSVAYWYQREPHDPFPELPSRGKRQPILSYATAEGIEGAVEGECLGASAVTSGAQAIPLRFQGEWSAGRFLWFVGDSLGDSIALQVPVDVGGKYEVVLYLAKASDFGVFQLKVDGKDLGVPFDGYNGEGGVGATHVVREENVLFGTLELERGTRTFEFLLVGKNERATSYMVGIDCLLLRPYHP